MDFVEHNDVSQKIPVESKRPYRTPTLSDYGDIREITQTAGTGHTHDMAGSPPNNKTG